MKKNATKDQEQKAHRLRLNRETLRSLEATALLGLARGGGALSGFESCETITQPGTGAC